MVKYTFLVDIGEAIVSTTETGTNFLDCFNNLDESILKTYGPPYVILSAQKLYI